MDDADAIWKPGYEGPPPVEAASARRGPAPSPLARNVPSEPAGGRAGRPPGGGATSAAPSRSSRRWKVAAAGALGLAVVVAAVVRLGDRGDESDAADRDVAPVTTGVAFDGENESVAPPVPIGPADPDVFGGPEGLRLAPRADALWSVDVGPAGDDDWVEVVRDEIVLVGSATAPGGAGGRARTQLVALDADSGERRWSAGVRGTPDDVDVVGTVDDVVVVERTGGSATVLVGLDLDTGDVVWSVDGDAASRHVGLTGTPLVAQVASPQDGEVTLVDARSGAVVGAVAVDENASGEVPGFSTDRDGTWYVAADDRVIAHDFRSGFTAGRPIGQTAPSSQAHVVVADRLLSVDERGRLVVRPPDESVDASVEWLPGQLQSLTPVSESRVVATAPSAISGLTVDEDRVVMTWARTRGAVVEIHPTAAGSLLQVATRGGAAMELVDGTTGRTVEYLTMTPSALQSLAVVGDGLVVLRRAAGGGEGQLVGLTLDGTVTWSIPGVAPVVLGDGLVVRAEAVDVGGSGGDGGSLRVTAFGDAG